MKPSTKKGTEFSITSRKVKARKPAKIERPASKRITTQDIKRRGK